MTATTITNFYGAPGSLFIEAYDAFHVETTPQYAGDTAFYLEFARAADGPTLELACGTGRVTLPLAAAGIAMTGVDLSPGMLAAARRKAEAANLPVEFVQQDMAALALDARFSFAFVPFRSFQFLLTVEQQRQALGAVHRHLIPGGRLALHLFDPRLDLLLESTPPIPTQQAARDGRRFFGEVLRTRYDHLAQMRHDLWRYAELAPDGSVLREETAEMTLRWTYRWELRHLLVLEGFVVEAEYSDFRGIPPAYGRELIVVARRL